jgi:hypothetical protein
MHDHVDAIGYQLIAEVGHRRLDTEALAAGLLVQLGG